MALKAGGEILPGARRSRRLRNRMGVVPAVGRGRSLPAPSSSPLSLALGGGAGWGSGPCRTPRGRQGPRGRRGPRGGCAPPHRALSILQSDLAANKALQRSVRVRDPGERDGASPGLRVQELTERGQRVRRGGGRSRGPWARTPPVPRTPTHDQWGVQSPVRTRADPCQPSLGAFRCRPVIGPNGLLSANRHTAAGSSSEGGQAGGAGP